jgi:hypothetical protein
MQRPKRVAQYIQQLAYETLYQQEARDERPDDVLPSPGARTPSYATWSATSFSDYVPFRIPTNG